MLDPLEGLNPEQRQVVTTLRGPVLVLAGAGSGKTRALTHRLAYLVATKTARPEELLAVTFTNKAAREMRERLVSLTGASHAAAITCRTFHSLGARLLREQYRHTTRSQTFTILDTGDAERLIKQILDQHNINAKQWSPRAVRQAISKAKNSLSTPTEEVVATVMEAYQKALIQHDCYDFDDLIGESLALLRDCDSARQHYQARWPYISIDEYQDTNPPQEAVVRYLLGPDKNLCVVGDDYQAIYSWRGAAVHHILRFEENYPNCTTIYLTQNYRSTATILSAANAVIAENAGQKHKQLWTDRVGGTSVSLIAVGSDRDEAQVVLHAIKRHVASGGQARDCAILYRTNAQSRLFEEALVAAGVPYTIVGGLRFYDRAEIKDALALVQFLVNPRSAVALQRIANTILNGIGPKTIARLREEAQTTGQDLLHVMEEGTSLTPRQRTNVIGLVHLFRAVRAAATSPREQIATLLEKSGYRLYVRDLPDGAERMENIEELLNVASSYQDMIRFVEEISLLADIDAASPDQDQVLCMTLHAAKGLEFKYVWLVGCEEGLLPHSNSVNSTAEIEEERRLLYVGMTRAREHLTITHSRFRTLHGQQLPQVPSRFLDALPEKGVDRLDVSAPQTFTTPTHPAEFVPDFITSLTTPGDTEVTYSAYEVGDIIVHPVFGRGAVIQTQGSTVTAVFEGSGIRTFSADSVNAVPRE